MDVIATAKYIRQSPRKVRLVATAVRELSPAEAMSVLGLTNARAAKVISDVIQSAIANATHNYQLQASNLRIRTLEVGEGPTLKRVRARSRGMANPVHKRTSHIRVVLTDEAATVKKGAKVAVLGSGDQKLRGRKPQPVTIKKEHHGS